MELLQRYLGCLLGLACGDAVGASVEFYPRGRFPLVTGMGEGGKFKMRRGEWTDDTAMALCLAESLISCQGFNALDQMQRYRRWAKEGHLSTRDHAFGLGQTVVRAFLTFERTGSPIAGSTAPNTAGNGSLMRLAPVVLWFYPDIESAVEHAAYSSLITHGASEAVDCCRLLAAVLCNALSGCAKENVLNGCLAFVNEPAVQRLAEGGYRHKIIENIRGSGYAVESLEAALWCVHQTNSFEDAVLAAANLGDDADTTAAITGQIAGALYGIQVISENWLSVLHRRSLIEDFAVRLTSQANWK